MAQQESFDNRTLYEDEGIKVSLVDGQVEVLLILKNGDTLRILQDKTGWDLIATNFCPMIIPISRNVVRIGQEAITQEAQYEARIA